MKSFWNGFEKRAGVGSFLKRVGSKIRSAFHYPTAEEIEEVRKLQHRSQPKNRLNPNTWVETNIPDEAPKHMHIGMRVSGEQAPQPKNKELQPLSWGQIEDGLRKDR